MDRYVFVKHEVQSFEGIHALIRGHKPGRGVRAQVPIADNQVTHVYALQGETLGELDAMSSELVLPGDTMVMSLDVCTSIPCTWLGSLFSGTPQWLPPYDVYIFLHLELIVEVEAEGDFVLPDIRSEMAGVAVDGGRELLVQLGGDDLDVLLHDVGAWILHDGVGRVRAYRGSGTDMVRNPDQ